MDSLRHETDLARSASSLRDQLSDRCRSARGRAVLAAIGLTCSLTGCAVYTPYEVCRWGFDYNSHRACNLHAEVYDLLPPKVSQVKLLKARYNVGPEGQPLVPPTGWTGSLNQNAPGWMVPPPATGVSGPALPPAPLNPMDSTIPPAGWPEPRMVDPQSSDPGVWELPPSPEPYRGPGATGASRLPNPSGRTPMEFRESRTWPSPSPADSRSSTSRPDGRGSTAAPSAPPDLLELARPPADQRSPARSNSRPGPSANLETPRQPNVGLFSQPGDERVVPASSTRIVPPSANPTSAQRGAWLFRP